MTSPSKHSNATRVVPTITPATLLLPVPSVPSSVLYDGDSDGDDEDGGKGDVGDDDDDDGGGDDDGGSDDDADDEVVINDDVTKKNRVVSLISVVSCGTVVILGVVGLGAVKMIDTMFDLSPSFPTSSTACIAKW